MADMRETADEILRLTMRIASQGEEIARLRVDAAYLSRMEAERDQLRDEIERQRTVYGEVKNHLLEEIERLKAESHRNFVRANQEYSRAEETGAERDRLRRMIGSEAPFDPADYDAMSDADLIANLRDMAGHNHVGFITHLAANRLEKQRATDGWDGGSTSNAESDVRHPQAGSTFNAG